MKLIPNTTRAWIVCAILTIAACAPVAPRSQRISKAPAQATADDVLSKPPDLVALAPFPVMMMTAQDDAGRYFSVASKVTFELLADGRLSRLAAAEGEPLLHYGDDESADATCTAHGGGWNQRTSWFPYTAIFVRGGRLAGAQSASGEALRALPLSKTAGANHNGVLYTGSDAREIEYSYLPCVGSTRVDEGSRLDRYLRSDDRLQVIEAGKPTWLTLPQPFVPYVLVRYEAGAMIPVPMRIVLVTVDLLERRVVVQLQATLAQSPRVRKLEVRAVLPDGEPGADESEDRYRQRTRALLDDLEQCEAPVLQAIEPCANAARRPDSLIFVRP